MHKIKGFIDIFEGHGVSNQRVDTDFALHIPVDNFGDIGAAAGAAEGGSSPGTPRHQLKRAGGNFLTGTGNTDNTALPPALAAALQRLAHDIDVANAFKTVIDAAMGHLYQVVNHIIHLLGIDEVGHTKLLRQCHLGRIEINTDNTGSPHHLGALNHIETNAAETENRHGG